MLQLLRLVDPEGVELRKRRRLKHRQYVVPGSNHIWHVDGYDKLKPYGFAINGCIDGFSRKMMWLKLGTTNNKPEVIAHHFVEAVLENELVPTILRADAGNENPIAGLIQQALRHNHLDEHAGERSFIVGPSTKNVRIERFWGECRAQAMGHYIDMIKALIDENIYNNKDVIERELLDFASLVKLTIACKG